MLDKVPGLNRTHLRQDYNKKTTYDLFLDTAVEASYKSTKSQFSLEPV